MPRFAANLTTLFNEVPFLERFSAAAQAGFEAVEFLFPYAFEPAAIARELQTYGLENVLFNLPPGNWQQGDRGLAAIPGREAEFRESLVNALRYASALGTPRLHVMAGLLSAGANTATFVDNLRYAAAEADRCGVTLLIEPLNARDMPGYLLNNQAAAHELCAAVGAANLQVQMDLYHVQISEGDIATRLRRYLPGVGHIQIAGVPDRHEPDQGELNYSYLFELIDALGYKGWIGCEYFPAHGTRDGLRWLNGEISDDEPRGTAGIHECATG